MKDDIESSEEAERLMGNSDTKKARKKPSQAELLFEIGCEADLIVTPSGEPYARCRVDDHWELYPITEGASRVKDWLQREFYMRTESAANLKSLDAAVGLLSACAKYEGQKREIHTRVGEHGGDVYLDLADERWRAVRVTAEGWAIVENPPICFRRPAGMLPLPEPEGGGSVGELRQLVNVQEDKDFMLVVGYLLGTLWPRGPFVHLGLVAEQGAAKSTLTRITRSIVDPNEAPIRTLPRDERDLAIAARNSWILAFDNVSELEGWLSDDFCRLSTGHGFATRRLYRDAEETLFAVKRPVILNGITEVVRRNDLLDRMIFVALAAIPPEKRKSEADIDLLFKAAHPRILGALLDAVSVALRRLPGVELGRLPRMADFVRWVEAAAPALKWGEGEFMQAFESNQQDSIAGQLEGSPLVSVLLKRLEEIAKDGAFDTTATLLLNDLNVMAGDKKPDGWPTSAKELSNHLRRLIPALRVLGWDVEFGKRKAHARPIHIRRR